MKIYVLLFFIACQSYVVSAQQNGNNAPYETKSLSGDAIKDVNIKTSGGSISVSGAAGEAARIEVYVHGNNGRDLTREEAKKRLDEDYNLEISVTNHELHAVAKRKHDSGFNWGGSRQLSISFKVFVPRQVSTQLNTSGGSIHLDNLSGQQSFSTSGGSIHVDRVEGVIKGGTSGGSIEVANSSDNINLETSGGSIRATNCRGKIKLETSGGSLHLERLKGTVNAVTSGGSIQATNIEGELITGTSGGSVNLSQLSCSVSASTSGGNMNVDLSHAGKYVKLDVSGGSVHLKLPAKQGLDLNLSANRITKPANTDGFTGEWEKDRVKGSINGGGIPVKVDASGHLDVTFN